MARSPRALPIAGGTLTGALTLAGNPTSALQAATKGYVDSASGGSTGVINVRSAPYNAKLNGVADDTAAFTAAYQAAAAGSVIHVPNGVTVLEPPPSWGIPLTKRVKWIVDGTLLPDGTPLADAIPGGGSPASNYLPGIVVGNSSASVEVSQNGSQPTDFAVAHSSYIVNHSGGPTGGAVIANTRNDTIIYNSPSNFVWGGIDRLLWCGTQTPSGAPAAEHVGRYVQTIRQNVGLDSSGKALPQPNLWAACLEYRDITGQASSMAASSITVEMDWFGNGPDDGGQRQIQSLVIGQHNTSGAPVEVSTIIGVYLAAGCTGHAYQVFNVNVPFSTSVLDTTGAQQMAGAAAIRMAAGHAIAFEPTNSLSARIRQHHEHTSLEPGSTLLSGRQGNRCRLADRLCQQRHAAELHVWQYRLSDWRLALHDYTAGGEQRRSRYRIHLLSARFGQRDHGGDRQRHDRQRPRYAASERSLPRRLGRRRRPGTKYSARMR